MKIIRVLSVCFFFLNVRAEAQLVLKDIFNRNLNNQTIILTDWEGYMANPAVRLILKAPVTAQFPLTVTLKANGALLYFNMPSTASASGPEKTIKLKNANPVSFYISNFPDRDTISEKYDLTINTNEYGIQTYSIRVIDQDIATPQNIFQITPDYSQDTEYNFFKQQVRKKIVQSVCDDWSYFINSNFDSVAAGAQDVFIWTDNYVSGHYAYNSKAYKGYYLFAQGVEVDPNISGGGPSYDSFQTVKGRATGLRRAGGYDADPRGNYNSLGWNTSIADSTWFLATNLGTVPNDLYSIAHHETGHALCFSEGYTQFDHYKQQGYIDDTDVMKYERKRVYINADDHLVDSSGKKITDRISMHGDFGSEYANVIPYGRWLITKLELLVMKAIGYKIKNTSAFKPTTITTASLPDGNAGTTYKAQIVAAGGIPFYDFKIVSQSLPPGLQLNSFSGVISGTPTQMGTYSFIIQVIDYDSVSAEKMLSIHVASSLKNAIALSRFSYHSANFFKVFPDFSRSDSIIETKKTYTLF
jgi:hypothetical protein